MTMNMTTTGPRRATRTAVIAGAAVAAVATPMIAAQPASAAQSQCSANRLCVWQDDGFTDGFKSFGNGTNSDNWNDFNFDNGADLNDRASSVINSTDRWVALYQHDEGAGFMLCIAPGAGSRRLADYKLDPSDFIPPVDTFTDRASSHRWHGSTKPNGCNAEATDAACSF